MISWLIKITKGFRGKILLSFLFGSLTVFSGIGLFGTSAYLITMAATMPSIAVLQVPIVGVRFFGISRSVFRYVERLISHSVNLKLLANIRVWVFKNLLSAYPFREKEKTNAEILATLVQDINTLENFFVRLLSPIVVTVFVIISVSIFFGFYAWEISLAVICGLFLTGFLIPWIAFVSGRVTADKISEQRLVYQNQVISFFESYQELSLLQPRTNLVDLLEEKEKNWAKQKANHHFLQAIFNSVSFVTVQVVFVVVMVISAFLVQTQRIDPILMAVFSLMTLAAFETASALPASAQFIGDIQTAGRNILSLQINEVSQNTLKIAANAVIDLNCPIRLKIENLTFRYSADKELVLQDFNEVLFPGKKTAVVGESGVGKSTLVNILMGFYDDYEGKISINGLDYHQIPAANKRNIISYVGSDLYLFETSLIQNFHLASETINTEGIEDLLKTVQLNPDKLSRTLGENLSEFGNDFSSGEKQRLHLAQALGRGGEIYLLDEPTANLDPMTGKKLMDDLFKILDKKSVLWITHQFQGMEYFDEIIVLKDHKIVERGDHQTLIGQRGEYFKLYSGQFPEILAKLSKNFGC